MIFFTSDTHYQHKNIIEYSSRPFKDLEEMHQVLWERWCARVGENDTVYHLGDFAMGSFDLVPSYRARLPGRIILIRGNHDRSRTKMLAAGFDEVHERLILELGALRFKLRHHPPKDDSWTAEADYYLCGHVHEAWARRGNVINVGVDVSDFRPLTLEELLAR